MSAGSPRIILRVSREQIRKINEYLASRNKHKPNDIWTHSHWIRDAIDAKIAHTERSRCSRAKKPKMCSTCDQTFKDYTGTIHFGLNKGEAYCDNCFASFLSSL